MAFYRLLRLALMVMLSSVIASSVVAAAGQGAISVNPRLTADGQSTILAEGPVAGPDQNELTIKTNDQKKPEQVATLQFNTASLPRKATLISCRIQITIVGVNKLTNLAARTEQKKSLTIMRVDGKARRRTGIEFPSGNVCQAVAAARGKGDKLSVKIEATTPQVTARIYSVTAAEVRSRPRLIVAYRSDSGLRRNDGWLQARHNAQHDGRSDWQIYDANCKCRSNIQQDANTVSTTEARDAACAELSQRPHGTAGHEPACVYSPKAYDMKIVSDIKTNIDGVWQSPLLVDDDMVVASDDRQLRIMPRVGTKYDLYIPGKMRYLAATPQGDLIVGTENKIYIGYRQADGRYSRVVELVSLDKNSSAPTKTPRAPITVASDGSFFVATDADVAAYRLPQTPDLPARLLWSNFYGQKHVSSLALSKDEATAYLLIGGEKTRLLALDTATGRCRWDETIGTIKFGENAKMPIPVVSGRMILVADDDPPRKTIYVFIDRPNNGNRMESSEVVEPDGSAGCDHAQVRSFSVSAAERVLTPVASPQEGKAYVLKDGRLYQPTDDGAALGEEIPVKGCTVDALKKVTRIVGDNGDGQPNTPTRLYGLASEKLFFIDVRSARDQRWARCQSQPMQGLDDNLLVSKEGFLLNHTVSKNFAVLVPKLNAAPDLDLSEIFPSNKENHPTGVVFRAGLVKTTKPLVLDGRTDIILQAVDKIIFGPGFRVKSGARLRARVGDINPYSPPPVRVAK